jgi:TPP-dependent pyruvate/acetoin dehydrogenase alpha subunit
VKISKNALTEMLYWMLLGRRLEERITVLFREGRLRGHHHPGIGQEATNVGVTYPLRDDDYIAISHRGKSSELMRGIRLKDLVGGYYAKKDCLQGGLIPTGSHMYGDLSKGVIPMPGIIGSVIPIAVGAGLAQKMKKNNGVVICIFGDGACNRGDFHEGVNMAAALKLPVVFVLANNGYSMSVSVEKATGLKELSVRAAGYGIPGLTIDGNDVLQVYQEAVRAIKRARDGKGASLIECMVHRWTGHSISDADVYRTDEQRREGEKRDPVARFKKELLSKDVLTGKAYDALEKRVAKEIEQAVEYSENECVFPNPADVLKNVYAQS